MANPNLARTLARFEATVHRTKNRLVAIPAAVQRDIGLVRRPDNHIIVYSIRVGASGRWNHRLAFLTEDNEFAVQDAEPGDHVEVKLHRMIRNIDALEPEASGGALLCQIAAEVEEAALGDETLDAARHDEALYSASHG